MQLAGQCHARKATVMPPPLAVMTRTANGRALVRGLRGPRHLGLLRHHVAAGGAQAESCLRCQRHQTTPTYWSLMAAREAILAMRGLELCCTHLRAMVAASFGREARQEGAANGKRRAPEAAIRGSEGRVKAAEHKDLRQNRYKSAKPILSLFRTFVFGFRKPALDPLLVFPSFYQVSPHISKR